MWTICIFKHMIIPEWDPEVVENGTTKAHRIIRLKPLVPSTISTLTFLKDPFGEYHAMNLRDARNLQNLFIQFCEDFLKRDDLIDRLRVEQYDVGMTEYYDYCPLGLFKVLNIKSTVLLSSTPISDLLAETLGMPSPPSYVTNIIQSSVDAPVLNFKNRLLNFFIYFYVRCLVYGGVLNSEQELFRKRISQDFADLRRLAQRAGVAFVNTLPIFDIPRPISSKIVFIGGIMNEKATHPLNEEFTNIFEKANKGVVLLTMGSIADPKRMPNVIRNSLLEAFSKFPDYEFIVKMKRPDGTNAHDYKNIHFFDWIDQINILNHPMTKGFICHGGLNSLTEAAFSGTPTICTPLFGDQDYNTAVAVKEGSGMYIDIRNTNAEQIYDALDKILNNPSYMEAAKHLQKKLLQYPHNITDLFVKYTEYVAQFDDFSTMNLYGANLDYITYFSIDVIAFLFLVGFTVVTVSLLLLYYSVKCCTEFVKVKKE